MSTLKVDDIQSRQSTDDAISLASDSSVTLKHSASAKLTTTATGVSVTGTCAATAYTGDGSALTGISSGVTVQEEGSSLSTAGTTLNFVGAGVTASGTGASKTITVPGGGGGMEFVSKSTISSNNSTTQINLTGLDYGSLYRVVMKLGKMSGSGQPLIRLYLDGTINNSGIIDFVSNNGGYMQQLLQDRDEITLYTAGYDESYWEYEMIFMTGYYGWFRTMQHPPGHSYPAGWGQCWGHLNPSNLASKRISGLSLRHSNSRTFQIGTEVLLYKFKES